MLSYQFPFTAIHIDGTTRILSSVEQFKAFTRHHKVAAKHFEHRSMIYEGANGLYRTTTMTHRHDWIVRDGLGRVVDGKAYEDMTSSGTGQSKWRSNFTYRKDPVPYCGRVKYPSAYGLRKKNGGWGIQARIRAFHSRDPRQDIERDF